MQAYWLILCASLAVLPTLAAGVQAMQVDVVAMGDSVAAGHGVCVSALQEDGFADLECSDGSTGWGPCAQTDPDGCTWYRGFGPTASTFHWSTNSRGAFPSRLTSNNIPDYPTQVFNLATTGACLKSYPPPVTPSYAATLESTWLLGPRCSGVRHVFSGSNSVDPPGAPEGQVALIDEILRSFGTSEPEVILVSGGANDVHFSACLTQLLLTGLADDSNLCSPDNTEFQKRLPQVRDAMSATLQDLRLRYPDALLVVRGYYNFMPKSTNAECYMWLPAVMTQEVASRVGDFVIDELYDRIAPDPPEWWEPVEETLDEFAMFWDAATILFTLNERHREIQSAAWSMTETSLRQLNEELRTAASAVANTVYVDVMDVFNGHEICTEQPYVYGPVVEMFGRQLPRDWNCSPLDKLLNRQCEDFSLYCPGEEADPDIPWLAAHLTGLRAVNCLPHPTLMGHHAMAGRIAERIKPALEAMQQDDCGLGADAADAASSATPISPSSTPCPARLTPADPADFFRFPVPPGARILATATPLDGSTLEIGLSVAGVEFARKSGIMGNAVALDWTTSLETMPDWILEARHVAGSGSYSLSVVIQATATSQTNQAPFDLALACPASGGPIHMATEFRCSVAARDADSSGVRYELSWGDGTTSVIGTGFHVPGVELAASHTYTTTGPKAVTLSVTDDGTPSKTSSSTFNLDVRPPSESYAPFIRSSSCPSTVQPATSISCSFVVEDTVDASNVGVTTIWSDGTVGVGNAFSPAPCPSIRNGASLYCFFVPSSRTAPGNEQDITVVATARSTKGGFTYGSDLSPEVSVNVRFPPPSPNDCASDEDAGGSFAAAAMRIEVLACLGRMPSGDASDWFLVFGSRGAIFSQSLEAGSGLGFTARLWRPSGVCCEAAISVPAGTTRAFQEVVLREDGDYRLEIHRDIGAGTYVLAPLSRDFDTTNPLTRATLSLPPGMTLARDVVEIALSCADERSGCDLTFFSWDSGATWNVYDPSLRLRRTTEGFHRIDFYSIDVAGNAEASKAISFTIDLSPPSIFLLQRPEPNSAGWYKDEVTLTWSCADANGVVAATTSRTLVVEGFAQSLTAACVDLAGNFARDTESGINLDRTPPTLTGARTPPPNAEGWNRDPVTIDWTCTDSLSGASGPGPDEVQTEGRGQARSSRCTDAAGNEATGEVTGINIDLTPPRLSATRAPEPNLHGWNRVDVVVSFLCEESLSGIQVEPVTATRSDEGPGQTVIGTCRDLADNGAELIVQDINIDKTAPSIVGARAPQPNRHGWNNATVIVSWNCADQLSGTSDPPSQVLSAEGRDQSRTATCTDLADNVASDTVSGINIDKTSPVTTHATSGPPGANGWYRGPARTALSSTDALSGVLRTDYRLDGASDQGTSVSVATDGVHLIEHRSVDLAGNAEVWREAIVKVDATAPLATASVPPPGGLEGWHVRPVAVDLTAVDAPAFDACAACEQKASGVHEIKRDLDGDGWVAHAPPFIVRTDGERTVRFYARDEAGNEGKVGSITFRLDTTPPVSIHVLAGQLGEQGWYISPVALTLSGSDGTSGLAEIRYRLGTRDGWQAYNGVVGLDAEGRNDVAYFAVDRAGNLEVRGHVLDIRIDTVMPMSLLAIGEPRDGFGPTYVRSATPLDLTGFDATSGLADLAWRTDHGPEHVHAGRFTLEGPDGRRDLDHRATDVAGNVQPWQRRALFVDDTPPTTTLELRGPSHEAGEDVFVSGATELRLPSEDAGVGVARTEHAVDDGDPAPAASLGLSGADGPQEVRFRSVDRLGNEETWRSERLVLDNTPPRTAFSAGDPRYDGVYLYVRSATDLRLDAEDGVGAGVDRIRHRVDGGAWSDVVEFSVLGEDGVHAIEFYAVDHLGNAEELRTQVVFLDNTRPDVDIVAPVPDSLTAGEHYIPTQRNDLGLVAAVGGSLVRVAVNASDPEVGGSASGMAEVRFFVNGELQAVDAEAPYAWAWDTEGLSFDNHTLKVVAYDRVGNERSDQQDVMVVPATLEGLDATLARLLQDTLGSDAPEVPQLQVAATTRDHPPPPATCPPAQPSHPDPPPPTALCGRP